MAPTIPHICCLLQIYQCPPGAKSRLHALVQARAITVASRVHVITFSYPINLSRFFSVTTQFGQQ